MNPLCKKSKKQSSLDLLTNDEQERSERNDQTGEENEAEIPKSPNLFEGQSDVNIPRLWLKANSMAKTLHQNRVASSETSQANTEGCCASSQSSQANTESCCGNNVFLLSIIIIGILSTAVSGFVLYFVLEIPEQCRCSPSSDNHSTAPERAISEEQFPEVLHKLKKRLKQEILDLKEKMNNFSRTLNDENQCDGEIKNCAGLSVEGFSDAYQRLKRQYNQTEETINSRFEQANAKVQKIADQIPNCLLNQAKESKNGTLVTVHVPKSSEDRVTVGVTCSTTLRNTADMHHLMPPSDNQDEFICQCKNEISKQTDCVAYFWQCKLK